MDADIRVAELPAARGSAWLVESFRLFRGNPIAWMGLCAGWISITFALLIIPFLGEVIANFLQPAFFASFAIAAYKQCAGERIAMAELFSGFQHNRRALLNLGALLLLAEVAIFVLMALMGLPIAGFADKEVTLAQYVEMLRGKEWILATGFVLTGLVKGALWFAPPLIAFHGLTTMHAVRWSVYAALSNFGAMAFYGATLMALFFVGLIPWAVGLVVVIPMMAISTYVGYSEVFEAKPR